MTEVGASRPAANRRFTARLACQLTVRYRAGKDWHPVTAMDLSNSGCRLRLGEDLPRGSRLSVVFETPVKDGSSALHVEVPGVVIWCRIEGLSHQAGIHFSKETPELEDILAALH